MSQRFELPAEVTIYSVMETRDALLAWAEAARKETTDTLEISAQAVGQVDAAGLQLLAALTNMEVPWKLTESSDAFAEACQTMGLAHWLSAPASNPTTPEATA